MPRLYGFEDNSRRRLHEDEVGPLREMASRALLDPPQSDGDIAVWANAQGYRGTLGGEWKDASIGRLLKNPAIAGLRRDENGELVDATTPGRSPLTSSRPWRSVTPSGRGQRPTPPTPISSRET